MGKLKNVFTHILKR